jgi:hypothetical protein
MFIIFFILNELFSPLNSSKSAFIDPTAKSALFW